MSCVFYTRPEGADVLCSLAFDLSSAPRREFRGGAVSYYIVYLEFLCFFRLTRPLCNS